MRNGLVGDITFTRKDHLLSNSSAEDDSPYPEVRAAVANFDDPDMPVTTIRAWLFGICWAMILPGMNQFFYFRYPTITVGSVRFPPLDISMKYLTTLSS